MGIIKHLATNLLSHSGLSLTFWYWASVQAAYEYRSRILGASVPKNAPTFGDRVLIRDIQGEGTSFDASAKEGVFLHWSMAVTNGAMVAIMTDPKTRGKRPSPNQPERKDSSDQRAEDLARSSQNLVDQRRPCRLKEKNLVEYRRRHVVGRT